MPKKVKEDSAATEALCPCKELNAFNVEVAKRGHEPSREDGERLTALRRKVWWCWNCQTADGCPVCTPRLGLEDLETRAAVSVCSHCGLLMSALAFVMEAYGFTPERFALYPEGWQCEYWAVFDNVPPGRQAEVRKQLQNEAALKRINKIRVHFGKPELMPETARFPTPKTHAEAGQMLRDWLKNKGVGSASPMAKHTKLAKDYPDTEDDG